MKLSIITINRNNLNGLKKTVDSVLAQTLRAEIEYIVVDGASIDGSAEFIERLWVTGYGLQEGGDENSSNHSSISIHAISEPDTGIYNAMNKGIRMATGEYLLFLNSGDFLINENVLKDVFSKDIDADIIVARCNVSDMGRVVWTSPFMKTITLKDLYFTGIPHQSAFIKRSLFDKYGMYREDFRYNSDIEFWYRSIVLGDAIACGMDVITTDYNLDGLSTKNSQTDLYKKEIEEILSQGFLPKILSDYELWKKERAVLNKYSWIESHKLLQKVLYLYHKLCKLIHR